MDYQEGRKNILFNGVIIILVIVAIGVTIWYLISKASSSIPDPIAEIKKAFEKAKQKTVQDATYPIPTSEAVNKDGDYYPVTTTEGLKARLEALGFFKVPVVVGDAITGGTTTEAGTRAAITVNKLGLNDEYVDLNPASKFLVSVGEGIGFLFGQDLIQGGYTFGENMRAEEVKTETPKTQAQLYMELYGTGFA
jgi:hypothetical protein